MRAPFREAANALTQAGYRCERNYTGSAVVFGGEVIQVAYFGGGSYSDNGGRHYASADTDVRARWNNDAYFRAVDMAKGQHPDLFAAINVVPRSDNQARAILERAAEFDALAVPLLAQAKAAVAVEQEARERAARIDRNKRQEYGVAQKMFEEVMRLHGQGLLADSNVLAGLKTLADEVDALRQDSAALADPAA